MVSLSEAYAIAIDHHRAGRFGEAAHVYRLILDADPAQADALHLLGVLCGQTGRTQEALGLIAEAIGRDPEAADYRDNFGCVLRTFGDARRAVRSHERALALAPQGAKAAFNRGLACADLGAAEHALRSHRIALRLDPRYGAAAVAAGRVLAAGDTPQQAEPWLRHALVHAPDLPDAWATLAKARLAAGDADGAIAGYARAVALRPDDGAMLGNLAMATLQTSGAMPEFARPDRPPALWPDALARTLDLFAAAVDRGGGDIAESALFRTAVLAVHLGMLDGGRLGRIAARARQRLRRVPGDAFAAAAVAHDLYRRDRLLTASRLARRYLRRFTPAEVRANPQLAKWRQIDARPVFLERLDGYSPRILEAAQRSDHAPPGAEGGAILLVSVDSRYWARFGGWFLAHVAERAPESRVHVHIVNPTDEDRGDLERRRSARPDRLSWSSERIDLAVHAPGAETTYYACARFFVARELLRRTGVPVFITDIDARCTGELDADLRDGVGWDLAIMRDPRARGPFDDIIVSFLGVAPTDVGRAFLDLVCRYIGWFFDRGEAAWTLDQAAPYAVYDHLKRRGRDGRARRFAYMRLPWFDFPEKGAS